MVPSQFLRQGAAQAPPSTHDDPQGFTLDHAGTSGFPLIASIRPIRWRITWTSLLALILALGSFYLNQWAYAYSDDECWWKLEPVKVGQASGGQNRIIIREVLPDGVAEVAGLLDGDELLAIQGRKVAATLDGLTAAQRQINAMPEGRILVYSVRRAGDTLHLPVRLVKPFDRAHCMRLITGLLFWALGLLVVVSSPPRAMGAGGNQQADT